MTENEPIARPVALLRFTDDKRDGAFPIDDGRGQLVAATRRGQFVIRFRTTGPDGAVLVTGRKRPLGAWAARDARHADIVRLRPPTFAAGEVPVELPLRGLTAVLRGSRRGGDWTLTGAGGTVLLSCRGVTTGALVKHDEWVVETDGTLTLAEFVGVVELHRLRVKFVRRTRGG